MRGNGVFDRSKPVSDNNEKQRRNNENNAGAHEPPRSLAPARARAAPARQ
jgi:hypothetical protein